MNVLIVGIGEVGFNLAEVLKEAGHHVRAVDRDPERAHYVESRLQVPTTIGDGDDPLVLEAADIRTMDVVCATTPEDEDNLVAGTLARFEFGVPHTIARVNHPRNEWLFSPELDLGIDVAISEAHLMAEILGTRITSGN